MANRKALKVEILGDAKGAVEASKDTEKALKGVERQAEDTGHELDDLRNKAERAGKAAGITLAGALGTTALSVGGLGAASAGAFAALSAGAAGAVLAVGGIGIAFAALNEDVKNSFSNLGTYVKDQLTIASAAFVPVLVGISDDLRGLFDEILPQLQPLLDAIAPLLGDVSKQIVDAIKPLVPVFIDLVNAGMPIVKLLGDQLLPIALTLADALRPVIDALAGTADMFVGPLVSAIKLILPPLGQMLATLVELGGPILATLATQLGSLLVTALTTLTPVVEQLAPHLDKLLSVLGPQLGELLGNLLPPLGQLLTSLAPLIPMLVELAGALINAFVTAVAPAIEALTPFIDILIAEFRPILDELIPVIQETAAQLGPEFARAVKESMPLVLELFRALAPYIPTLVDITGQAILFFAQFQSNAKTIMELAAAFMYVRDVMSGIFDGVVEGFKAAVNGILNIWNNLRFTVPNVPGTNFGGFTLDFPNVPAFDKGGVVPGKRGSPQLILAHGGETVLPTHTSNNPNERWVTYEGGSTGLQRRDENGNWYGVTPSMDPGAYNLKAALDYAAAMNQQNLKAGMEIGKWPIEDVKKIAALIEGRRTGASTAAGGPNIYISVNPITGQAIVDQVGTFQRNGGATPWVQVKR